jgi:hypothetical protein
MTSRKASILPENTLAVLIAVIGLALIFTAAWTLYKSVMQDNEVESAQNLVNLVQAKALALENNEKTTFVIQGIPNKKEPWYLTGWGKTDSVQIKPEKCFFDSCICVCKGANPNNRKDDCQNQGFCRKIEKNSVRVSTEPEFSLASDPINSRWVEVEIGPESKPFINLPPKLIEVNIFSFEDSVALVRYQEN